MRSERRADIIAGLQADILRLQGFKPSNCMTPDTGLGKITEAMPNGAFPLGAVHEFLSGKSEDAAATTGFISGLLASLMGSSGTALWISCVRMLFPPALKTFGVQPDRVIFIDLPNEKEVLWAMDESLKCDGLCAVVGEVKQIGFTASRRLQLAVEQSQVTGFILHHCNQKVNTTACVSRWKITSVCSEYIDGLPGVGFPQWRVELLRMRNGRAGVWNVKLVNGKFQTRSLSGHMTQDEIYAPSVQEQDFREQELKVG
jgi:protein ImuA